MLIRFTQHPFFIPEQEPSFALSLRSVSFILPLSNPLPSLLHVIPSHRISTISSSIPPQTAILYTPLHVIAHSGTCLSLHKLRLQKTAPALPHAAAFRCPHFVAGFLLPAPSLHSLTARASPFGFAKKSTPLRSAAFSLAFGRLKAALPILLIIVINENTAKIMWLFLFCKGQALRFLQKSPHFQVVFSQKTLTKQQATIVLYAKFCIYSSPLPFKSIKLKNTHVSSIVM